MSAIFGCEVSIASTSDGLVHLSFGPLDAGDVIDLLKYVGTSEDFHSAVLDQISGAVASLAFRDEDDDDE